MVLIMKVNAKFLMPLILFLGIVHFSQSQEIITADRYLEIVSERYAGILDYEANVTIRSDGRDMFGSLSYLEPNYLRIDFTNPADQVLVFNGENLTIYIPGLRAVLNQAVSPLRRTSVPGGAASIATAQGLELLRRGYIPSFLTGPAPVPLDSQNPELVVQLRLTRRLASESFAEIILSINPETLLIRRVEGRTLTNAIVRFDFTNMRTNLGIPEFRFIYDMPPTANVFHNFLFRDID